MNIPRSWTSVRTGDGRIAYRRGLEDDEYVLITDRDGRDIPRRPRQPTLVVEYTKDGEQIGCRMMMPFAEEVKRWA